MKRSEYRMQGGIYGVSVVGQGDAGSPGLDGASPYLSFALPDLRQPTTKLRPTLVSKVALAACRETDQVWSPTIPFTGTPAQV